MQKEKATQALVDFIEETKRKKIDHYGEYHEISLFSWQFSLKAMLERDFGIKGDIARLILVEAWNRTHPHRPYQINPMTLDNPSLSYEVI